MFYVLTDSLATRTRLIEHLRAAGILAVFHYVPLHSAPAGRRHGRAHGALPVTDEVSDRLVRLPLYYGITEEETGRVADAVRGFFG
jgi:dTDP-4-amino-4,6-dideoxygalactose transaminase